MNDIRFTDDQVMSTLRAVVGERPDFIYEAPGDDTEECVYIHNGAPSCLVGHVLCRLGMATEELSKYEGLAPQVHPAWFGVSSRVAGVLTEAQDRQDQGYTWSDALTGAEKYWEE